MSTRSHEKDVQQTKSARKRRRDTDHSTKNGMLDQKRAEAQKVSQKDHSDMNENARQAEEQLTAASAVDVPAVLDDDKRKDKKSKERRKSGARSRPGEPDHDVEEMPADHGADKEKKKGQAALVTDSTDSPPKSNSEKRKKDKDKDGTDSSSVPENRDGKTKKSSKGKHAYCNPDEAPAPVDTDQDQQPPKKKAKIVNPKKDELLLEQALKALAYAYSQYRHPEKWKFNKARQNWITRNVWSADVIPDQHLPLVTWYLKGVKGGVRDALIEKCQSHVQLSSQPQSESKPTTTESVPPGSTPVPLFGLMPEALGKPSENTAETKRLRAQILLEALQAP